MKIPMTHSYYDALCAIALLRVIDSKTLNLLFSSPSRRAQFTKKSISARHIKEVNAEESRKQERKSQTLYVITRAGIAFLAEQNGCFRELLEANAGLQIFSDYECRTSTRQRIAAVTTALVLSHCAGAIIPAEVFGGIKADDGDTYADDESKGEQKRGGYTLRDFFSDFAAKNAIDDMEPFLPEHQPGECGHMVYMDRTTVKQRIAEELFGQYEDFRPGRYAGILESAYKSLMLFTAPKFAMSWSKWLADAELNAYRLWGRTQSITPSAQRNASGATAALIVGNAREFAYHYIGEKRKREKREVFGRSFDHLYIIPNDPEGAKYLAWLMENDDAQTASDMGDIAVENGYYRERGSGMISDLHRRDDNIEVICGLALDTKLIDRIAYAIQRIPAKCFEIMCLDWQADYYKRVLPTNVSYRTFPSSILAVE